MLNNSKTCTIGKIKGKNDKKELNEWVVLISYVIAETTQHVQRD